MTAFSDWLADPGAVRRHANWIAELSPVDSAGAATTLRVCSRAEGFRTRPADSPANTLYRPDLQRGLDLQASLWGGSGAIAIGGASLPSEGKLVLANADGHYDAYRVGNGWSWGGRDCVVRLGSGFGLPGRAGFMASNQFRAFRFEMGEPTFGRDRVEVPIYGLDRRFDHPLTTLVYRGTGYALHFAAAAYSTHGTPAKLDITGDITLKTWIYFDNFTAERFFLGWFSGATRYPYQLSATSSGALRLRYRHSTGTLATHTMTAVMTAGRWNHVAVTIQGTAGKFVIYDGLTGVQTIETFVQAAASRDANSGGTFQLSLNHATNSHVGEMDDTQVLNVAQTPEDISANRHGPVVVVPAELVGYWKHDDASGTTTTDSGSGTAANGTLNGTTTWYHSLEGDASLAGQTKPDALGFTEHQEPALVDPVHLIYQVAGAGAVASIAPSDGLNPYTSGGIDITSHRTLQTTAVGTGTYRTYLALGLFKLGAPAPTLKLTATVTGYSYSTVKTKGAIIRNIITSRGPDPLADPGELDTAAFTAIDTADNSHHGLYVQAGERVTIREALDRLIGPASWWGFDFDSQLFTLAQWIGPAVTADLVIPANRILEFRPLGAALISWLVELAFARIAPHNEDQISGTVKSTAALLSLYQRGLSPDGWSVAPAFDAEIRDRHPRAGEYRFETQIQNPDPAVSVTDPMGRDAAIVEARRILDLMDSGYEPYFVRVDPIGTQLRLGETFAPTVQQGRGVYRLGFDGTRNLAVLDMKVDPVTFNVALVGLG